MVGLPRESKISRPIISAMLVCILRGYDARCARAVQQMLRKTLSGERAEDADLERGPAACAQSGASKPADSNNPRKGRISGVKLRWAHRLEVWVPRKRFALAISI